MKKKQKTALQLQLKEWRITAYQLWREMQKKDTRLDSPRVYRWVSGEDTMTEEHYFAMMDALEILLNSPQRPNVFYKVVRLRLCP